LQYRHIAIQAYRNTGISQYWHILIQVSSNRY
jgi:hypothetical protein